jgi:hypothetical protein
MTDQERTRWTKLVADYEASDLTQREFASERGVSFSNLRNWIYRLRKESRPLVPGPAKVSGQAPAARRPRRAASRPDHPGRADLLRRGFPGDSGAWTRVRLGHSAAR